MSRVHRATRARDIDRALVATALDSAYADGQLTYDEHRLRTDAARTAVTLGDLQLLAGDLQADVPLPEPKPAPVREEPTGRRPLVLGAVVVLAVVTTAVVLGIRDSGPTAPSPGMIAAEQFEPIVAVPFDFTTAGGLADFRDRYLARFANPMITDLTMFPAEGRASLTRVEDGRTRDVSVDGGFAVSADTDPLEAGYLPFDFSLIDTARLAESMTTAAAAVERPGASVTHVLARNTGTPEVLVYAADADGRGGYLQTGLEGDVIRTVPYRP
ncbi:DUF1707 SHOCT-like domain-containing protein [Rhodococcus sp. MEB064]|uniref:DUF1707 SHOCT-like domain-containing protein n=1 Tax=Rhodococcus sp. MEB064 TaxID=1587522 RepID=UPI0005AC2CA2|nr:DUF1707 domain-containing protein [Rhodococcus sp. MEB064]KIQ19318.1 hypothetical protein RU01_05000 [Rhodococcus sp. MEB064]